MISRSSQLAVGLVPAQGQPIAALPCWGTKPPEEGSSGQVSAAFLVGVVRKINHRIEPKSNKRAQKDVVRKAADAEPPWYTRNQTAPACPWFSPAARTGASSACPASTQPEAPAATGLRAGASYRLHLDFSIAARNAIFFYIYLQIAWNLKYDTNLDHTQGRWEFSPGQTFHAALLSRSSRVATSHAACLQTRTNVTVLLGGAWPRTKAAF